MSGIKLNRREALQLFTTSSVFAPLGHLAPRLGIEPQPTVPNAAGAQDSERFQDGPRSPLFEPVVFRGNLGLDELTTDWVSNAMVRALPEAPIGDVHGWGIPFLVPQKVVVLKTETVEVRVGPIRARWLVFMHTSDEAPLVPDENGFFPSSVGEGRLREHVADYVMLLDGGSEIRASVRRRHELGMFRRNWGVNCVEAVAHRKPFPLRQHHEQTAEEWGWSQTRTVNPDSGDWVNWLWAWENPEPEQEITGFRFEPVRGTVILSGISAGNVSSNPLRWRTRRKALLSLAEGTAFQPDLDQNGGLAQVRLDLGQVISATPRLLYPSTNWETGFNNQLPDVSPGEVVVEYTSHPEARFVLGDDTTVPVAAVEGGISSGTLRAVAPSTRPVKIRVLDAANGLPVAVKLHIHGEAGEVLPPVNRHRMPNGAWFEDYSVDFLHRGRHLCCYIPGEADLRLPIGRVYLEVSKGFEIKPIRKMVQISDNTDEIVLRLDRLLPWRERGWVTADTHVHFLSPTSALLEGEAEGVNVVNLLASQWGELMTNVGDFDGRTTHGSIENGGSGEYLVRVGTENRQHVMGHISLLGYEGSMIAPMTTGGPDESALGDPVEILLTEWAKQCRAQNGLVVLPHFPDPRLENAASIVEGTVDGVEMTSWQDLYSGINPYSLSDWYRYLNCGYFVAAVGGTDKMSAETAVGTVRTYAHLEPDRSFTYETWKDAVRNGRTFVTYGPLLEFSVAGKAPGTRFTLSPTGGRLDVEWQAASVTVPMSRVELIVNGEIREQQAVDPWAARGSWSVRIERSSWVALLIRGHYEGKPEIIAAHSSPVMVQVGDSEFFAAADAITILEQIEGALAYVDTIGTRADDITYKRMRLVLESAHRRLHNRMHARGVFHGHTVATDHPEHH